MYDVQCMMYDVQCTMYNYDEGYAAIAPSRFTAC